MFSSYGQNKSYHYDMAVMRNLQN